MSTWHRQNIHTYMNLGRAFPSSELHRKACRRPFWLSLWWNASSKSSWYVGRGDTTWAVYYPSIESHLKPMYNQLIYSYHLRTSVDSAYRMEKRSLQKTHKRNRVNTQYAFAWLIPWDLALSTVPTTWRTIFQLAIDMQKSALVLFRDLNRCVSLIRLSICASMFSLWEIDWTRSVALLHFPSLWRTVATYPSMH